MKDSKLISIQGMLLRQMERLDNDNLMKNSSNEEIARSNALSNSAKTFINVVNTNIKIAELSAEFNQTMDSTIEVLGLTNDEN